MIDLHEIKIQTARGEIYGRMSGPASGPLVLGVHGWSQRNGWHTWRALMSPLAEAGFRVISVDMPGWGVSPAWEKTPDKTAVAAMLDELETEAEALMGKSWGGGIALDFALTSPGRVRKLILTAPAFRGEPADLGRLSQPVLMAWAEDDTVIPLSRGEALAEAIPTCALERYPTGGHSAAQNNADDFAPKAVAFLKNQRIEDGS